MDNCSYSNNVPALWIFQMSKFEVQKRQLFIKKAAAIISCIWCLTLSPCAVGSESPGDRYCQFSPQVPILRRIPQLANPPVGKMERLSDLRSWTKARTPPGLLNQWPGWCLHAKNNNRLSKSFCMKMVIAPLHLLCPSSQSGIPMATNFKYSVSYHNACAGAWQLSDGQQFLYIYSCHNNRQEVWIIYTIPI